MTEPIPQKPRRFLRPSLLVATVLVLAAGLTAAWFFAAGKLDETVSRFRNDLATDGRTLNCNGQNVQGYPFRIGLFCESLAYADPVSAVTVSGGALRSAAQLYRPGHVVAEMDGPVNITAPGIAPLAINWQALRSSTNVSLDGLRRVSLEAQGIGIAANDAGMASPLGEIGSLQVHARPAGEDPAAVDLDLALDMKGWRIAGNGGPAPDAVDIEFDASVSQAHGWIRGQQDPLAALRRDGGKATVRTFRFRTASGSMLALRGPLSIDQRGLVSGDLLLDMDDPQGLVEFASVAFPPLAVMLADTSRILAGMSGDGGSKPQVRDLRITLKDGRIILGFIEIGSIPPLL